MTKTVKILMATFNGAKFIKRQLESILDQNHKDWQLVISDDGSVDATIKIINTFISANPKYDIKLIKGPRNGFVCNFLSMLQDVNSDYVCFCDQDDIWLPDKLSNSILKLDGAYQPTCYGARTLLIDENEEVYGASPRFKKPATFRNALVQNFAGGNTMMINGAGVELLQKVYNKKYIPVSHDWWVYLIISGAGGEIIYDKTPCVFYRQHGGNLIGSNQSFSARFSRIRYLFLGKYKKWNDTNLGILLNEMYILTPENKEILEEFVRARTVSIFKRFFIIHQIGVYRQTFFGNLALKVAVLFNKV